MYKGLVALLFDFLFSVLLVSAIALLIMPSVSLGRVYGYALPVQMSDSDSVQLSDRVLYPRTMPKSGVRRSYDGIDISKYQGIIEWKQLAADTCIQVLYMRATKSNDYVDPVYEFNLTEAHKYGFKVGSYHFLTSLASVDEQFALFLKTAEPRRQDLVPMLDVEPVYLYKWNRQQLQDSVAKFVSLMQKHYHCRPMIYSSRNFYNHMLAPRFDSYILYIAFYNRYEPVIIGDSGHNLWQFTERGHVKGIQGYVDLCRFTNGTKLRDITIRP